MEVYMDVSFYTNTQNHRETVRQLSKMNKDKSLLKNKEISHTEL